MISDLDVWYSGYFAADRCAKYIGPFRSACYLSACLSKNTCPNFTKFSVHVTCGSLWPSLDPPLSNSAIRYVLPVSERHVLVSVLACYISSYSVSCFVYYILLVFYLYSSCNSVRMSH